MNFRSLFQPGTAAIIVVSGCVTWVLHGCAGHQESRLSTAPQEAPAYEAAVASYPHHFPVSTDSAEAQAAFDRGLVLAFAFNHGLAEKTFREAAALDPNLAMAWWGVALVNGPHINFPMVPEERAVAAWEALTRAQALAAGTSEKEQALIRALAARYASPQPEDRTPLDRDYAAAMREVWQRYPADADIATLFAEAMMDLRPWDLWTDEGLPQPGTEEILRTLERALELNPRHPGATHLYIHAVEASTQPARAETAADNLRDVASTLGLGVGHLIHMPSHLYARVGRWQDAADANEAAKAADLAYRAQNPHPGFFALYMMHNRHFFAWAAAMQGRSETAIAAAREMVDSVPPDFLEEYAPVADGFMVFVPEMLMRFGRWEEILAEPAPPEQLPLSQALWHFTRGVAHTALGQMEAAERERQAFRLAAERVPEDWGFGNNRATDLLAIASGMLDGEMAARREDFKTAVLRLEEAVQIEDRLRYDEPPDWIQPVRHTLGAVLLRAGRHAAAETVYREDLDRLPGNPWSLFGLARALRLQGRDLEAASVEQQYEEAWKLADVAMHSSCFCQPPV